jgi:predicted dehydrogenase
MRVGILCTARIAAKVRRGIIEAGNTVVAIASRDLFKAQEWATEAVASGDLPSRPAAFGSYEALLASPDVDCVYIPLPCMLHLEWVTKAAAARKHVCVEKPAARSAEELLAMLAACREAGVLFIDGTMFHFHPRMPRFLAAVHDSAAFGEVRSVSAAFSFCGDDAFLARDIRTRAALEPLGCLGDLGQYCIRMALEVYQWKVPDSVSATAELNGEGVPLHVAATFRYRGGSPRVACVECSFRGALRQRVEVEGERALARMDDFVIPRAPEAATFTVEKNPDMNATHDRILGVTTEEVVPAAQGSALAGAQGGGHPARGLSQEGVMWQALRQERRPAQWALWAQRAYATQVCLDACMASIERGGAEAAVEGFARGSGGPAAWLWEEQL